MDYKVDALREVETIHSEKERFRRDVIAGLENPQKRLDSKYIYDERGDALFQRIMRMPEYYLTRCELDIFEQRMLKIVEALDIDGSPFDLVELGAGDATKSIILLDYLIDQQADFRYRPIDISANILRVLADRLAKKLPTLDVDGLHGDYFEMLNKAGTESARKKIVLFLGSNIGNMELGKAYAFCRTLRRNLHRGDMALIGFDLQKDPAVILGAYNDTTGITAAFNLNLLTRINRELDADFDFNQFRHYPTYDPGTGECRSYLISQIAQQVRIGNRVFSFQKHEAIHTEISRKYAPGEIYRMAVGCGFSPVTGIMDDRGWFIDMIWKVI